MFRKISVFILPILLIASLIALMLFKKMQSGDISSKNQIVTSFYPLYFFTSKIVGDKFDVINITPSGVEPHDYELTTGDLVSIQNSKLLIVNGSGLEPWLEKLKSNFNENGLTIAIIGDRLTKNSDPHIWLDPILAKSEVDKITQNIIKIDSKNSAYYLQNKTSLMNGLDNLDKDFKTGLSRCKHNQVVTSHASFGYLARRYNLKQIAISGLSPDEEPTPTKISEIAKLITKNDIKYIFFEKLVSPRLAETISSETGAKTIEFNPLEGLSTDDQLNKKDYFTVQRQNLKNLRIALECN